jgi:hypothetical protein
MAEGMLSAVEYVESGPLPRGLDNRSLRRRVLQIAGVLVIVGLVAALAPGLGEVRARINGAQPGWLGVAVVLELLSCLSYVLMFRPIFCARMSWRTSYQLGMSELAVGSVVPASGAAGLAYGAWALRKGGMPAQDIARRTVAFFVVKSAANFVAVAAVGIAMWCHVAGLSGAVAARRYAAASGSAWRVVVRHSAARSGAASAPCSAPTSSHSRASMVAASGPWRAGRSPSPPAASRA